MVRTARKPRTGTFLKCICCCISLMTSLQRVLLGTTIPRQMKADPDHLREYINSSPISKMLLNRLVHLATSWCYYSLLEQILRFDRWEYYVSWVRTMLDILDEASASDDTDVATEHQSSSLTSATASIVHTKLGSPKPETTLKEFMEVLTGPGNPLPRTFQGNLEAFLNNFCAVNHPSTHTRYMRVQKEAKVMRCIPIVCRLLT